MLVDTPYSMGCYKVHLDLQANPPSSTQMSDLSPAKCLFHCLTESDTQRYAGNGRCVLMAIFYHINIYDLENIIQDYSIFYLNQDYGTEISVFAMMSLLTLPLNTFKTN